MSVPRKSRLISLATVILAAVVMTTGLYADEFSDGTITIPRSGKEIVSLPSPEAAELCRHIDHAIDYSTGCVSLSFPLFTYDCGGITLPPPSITLRTTKTADSHIGPLTIRTITSKSNASVTSLSRVDTSTGYIADGRMHYYVRDYQGNVRQVTDADGTVEQDNHYYPYGMLMGESSDILAAARGTATPIANPYLYGAKEYLTTAGANLLDFTARTYDPSILLFHTPDPLIDRYQSFNAYLYCLGNPIYFTDFNGMAPEWWNKYNLEVRLWGLANAIGGLGEAACGALACGTGVGAAVGTVAVAHGSDVATAGIRQMLSGKETSSYTSQAIQAAGVSQEIAEVIDGSVSIALTGGATYFKSSGNVATASRTVASGDFAAGNPIDQIESKVTSIAKNAADNLNLPKGPTRGTKIHSAVKLLLMV